MSPSGYDEDGVQQLLHLWVACVGLAEYFTDEVNRSLHLVDVTWLVSFDDQGSANHMSSSCYVELGLLVVQRCEYGWFG